MSQKSSPPYETRGPPSVIRPEKALKIHLLRLTVAQGADVI